MLSSLSFVPPVSVDMHAAMPNDPKLSDRGVRRGTCMAGGKAAVEAGAVTHGAVRCSAWLGVAVVTELASMLRKQRSEKI